MYTIIWLRYANLHGHYWYQSIQSSIYNHFQSNRVSNPERNSYLLTVGRHCSRSDDTMPVQLLSQMSTRVITCYLNSIVVCRYSHAIVSRKTDYTLKYGFAGIASIASILTSMQQKTTHLAIYIHYNHNWSPRPSPFLFAYCKWSKTVGCEGLRTRLVGNVL